MAAYYNEFDPYAAQWLRNLIAAGLIAPGDVDERDIRSVRPEDIRGYRQYHWFAGIGGWSYALRCAGWSDDEEVWTASLPCQPLSVAGQRQGDLDERHLWGTFHRLVSECRPATIFGEQVSSKDGREWFAGVRFDLEALGFAVGGVDTCSASVGAPNIRQRLFWMAHAASVGRERRETSADRRFDDRQNAGREQGFGRACRPSDPGTSGLGDAERKGLQIRKRNGRVQSEAMEAFEGKALERTGHASGVGDAAGEQAGHPRFPWRQSDTVACADGAIRRIEPGTFPLVARLPKGVGRGGAYRDLPRADQGNRQGRIRGYGNAINPVLAAEFIKASREAIQQLILCKP